MQLQKFTKDLFGEIRVVGIKGEPWFMAMDIACALGYSDTQAMTRRLDFDEQKTYTDNSSGQVRSAFKKPVEISDYSQTIFL